MSIVINAEGEYQFQTGTRTLETSEHPAHLARVELGMAKGKWLYAPDAGHELTKFTRVKQTDAKVEEFRKVTVLFLRKYDPEVISLFTERGGVTMNLEIDQEVLDGV